MSDFCRFYDLSEGQESHLELYLPIGNDFFEECIDCRKFSQELNAVPRGNRLRLHVNSPGGSIPDGLTIYNLLKARGNVVTVIEGVAASIASVIALAGDSIEACSNSLMIVHKPMIEPSGMKNADELAKIIDNLNKWEDQIIGIYREKTGLDVERLREMLRDETWLTANEALGLGFVDRIIGSGKEKNFYNSFFLNRYKGYRKGEYKMSDINMINSDTDGVQDDLNKGNEGHVVIEDELNRLRTELDSYKNQVAKSKKEKAEISVRDAIRDGRILNTESELWVNMLVSSDEAYKALESLPRREDGYENKLQGMVFESKPAVENVVKELKNRKGIQKGILIKDNYKNIIGWIREKIYNGVTIDEGLKQNVIMSTALEEFRKVTGPLPKLFTMRFMDVPLEGTNTITLPYYPLYNDDLSQFYYKGESSDAETYPEGYQFNGSYKVQSKSITVDKRLYFGLSWRSRDLSREPFFEINKFFAKMGENLGYKLWVMIFNQIKAASYTTTGFASPIEESAFDSDAVAELNLKCQTMDWGSGPFNMILNSKLAFNLKVDPAIKNYAASGQTGTLYYSSLPPIYNFNIYENPNIPDNGEDLGGFIALPSALGIVGAPIRPDVSIPVRYEQITDPDTGMTLEARWSGNSQMDEAGVTLEVNFGMGVLEPKALIRIVTATTSSP